MTKRKQFTGLIFRMSAEISHANVQHLTFLAVARMGVVCVIQIVTDVEVIIGNCFSEVKKIGPTVRGKYCPKKI